MYDTVGVDDVQTIGLRNFFTAFITPVYTVIIKYTHFKVKQ